MRLQRRQTLWYIVSLLLAIALLSACDVAPEPTPERVLRKDAVSEAFFPVVAYDSGLRKCVEVWTGISPIEYEWLQELKPYCIKVHFNSNTKGDAWHSYLAHGWSEMDEKFVPDLEKFRSIGALVIFTIQANRDNLTCQPLPFDQLESYIQFVNDVIIRYDLEYVEIGNEVDAVGGFPGRFGCHGKSALFVNTWQAVRAAVPSHIKMGVSFMTDTPEKKPFIEFVLERIEPDWAGIHHYEYYSGEKTLAGGLAAWELSKKYAWVQAQTDSPVWITETNLLWPGGDCGEGFQEAQAMMIKALAENYGTVVTIYVMNAYPGWVCAAINPGSPAWEYWISYDTDTEQSIIEEILAPLRAYP